MAALFLANESLGTDDAFPSTFELIMQERMASGFKPAAQYLVTAICDAYPHVASTLPVRHFHETYALVRLGLERYCLAHYDCLLVERFYGIKRMELTDAVDNSPAKLQPLSAQGRRRSLMWHVGVPYLKAKVDAYYHSLLSTSPPSPRLVNDDETPLPANPSRFTKFWRHWRHLRIWSELRSLFVDLYPAVHFSYEGLFLVYQWMYLFGHTKHFTPFLRAIKVVFARITPKDISTFESTRLRHRSNVLANLTTTSSSSTWNSIRRWVYQATWTTIDYSQTIVVLAIVGFKFMEWLQSDMNPQGRPAGSGRGAAVVGKGPNGAALPPPPPPVQPALSHSAISLSSETNRCGLCHRQRTNPASCVSGFVFCYPCIHSYVADHGECPVTRLPCDVGSISRMYEDTSNA